MASSVEELIRRELETLAPREDRGLADWSDVRRRAGIPISEPATDPSRQSQRSRRRLVAAVVVVVLLTAAVAVPSLALSSHLRDLLGLADTRPRPVFAKARLLVEVPADRGEVARLYEAPSSVGGRCWFVDRVPRGSPVPTTDADAGSRCQLGQSATPPARDAPMTWSIGMQPKTRNNLRGWRAPILDGWVNPELDATRVVLEWDGGSVELPFRNDHFLFISESLYEPPEANLPYELVAYDAVGAEVARVRIFKTALYLP